MSSRQGHPASTVLASIKFSLIPNSSRERLLFQPAATNSCISILFRQCLFVLLACVTYLQCSCTCAMPL